MEMKGKNAIILVISGDPKHTNVSFSKPLRRSPRCCWQWGFRCKNLLNLLKWISWTLSIQWNSLSGIYWLVHSFFESIWVLLNSRIFCIHVDVHMISWWFCAFQKQCKSALGMANDSNHLIHQRSEPKSNETSNNAGTSYQEQKALRSFYPLHPLKKTSAKKCAVTHKVSNLSCVTWKKKWMCHIGLRWMQENMTV